MVKPRTFGLSPILLVIPMLLIVWLLWSNYYRTADQITLPQQNIMPNSSLGTLDNNGVPDGWQLSQSGESSHTYRQVTTSDKQSSWQLTISNYRSGSLTFNSPIIPLKPGSTYFYKGFYKSTMPLELLANFSYSDGSSKTEIVKRYPDSEEWSTTSDTFKAETNVESVQFIYNFASNGTVDLKDNFMLPNPIQIYMTPPPATSDQAPAHLPSLVSETADPPADWSSFSIGNNHATFAYQPNDGDPYVRSQVTDYKDGEAKWQYEPLPVSPGQAYEFKVRYRGDSPADVVAEYVLDSGERRFDTITTLMPIKDWVDYMVHVEVPAGATNMLIAPVMHHNGTFDTTHYDLRNISQPGPAFWQQPLLSFTFDDGWASAFTNGARLLDTYGFKGTFYLNPSSIDTPEHFGTSYQVKDLAKRGHELASHGYEHFDFTTYPADKIDYQLGHAREYFAQILGQSKVDFATPYGNTDPQVEYFARQYYASLRTTDSGINTRQNFNPYNLRVLYVGTQTPLSTLAENLQEAKDTHGWLVLVYHRVETGIQGDTAVSPANFQKQLEQVRKSGIAVKPVSAALAEVESQ